MFLDKLKEVLQAILPMSFIVILLHFFFVPLHTNQLTIFFIGTTLVFFGLTIFLFGVDVSISQMGQILGKGLALRKKLWLVVLGGLFIGFIISLAEPSLTVLGQQIQQMTASTLNQTTVVIVVSIGVAVFMTIGLMRIVFQWNIRWIITIFYSLIFLLLIFTEESFITFAFDSSGATTGTLTVPFMLSLSSGITALSSDSQSEEFHFGLVGITSIGPILAMLILGIMNPLQITGDFSTPDFSNINIWETLQSTGIDAIKQVLIGVAPLLIIFLLYHGLIEKQTDQTLKDILLGLLYLMIGLVLFLTGISSGFMPISQYLGAQLYTHHSNFWVIAIGFILGIVAILAEPAIYVLTDQIEEVTGGTLKRITILLAIAIGVGSAIALTILRIFIADFRLWHILIVGFLLIIAISWCIPNLFVGMAFDSGGTASGPMTGTFIFAFVQGISISHPHADPILDGFGMIAVVAMTPILFIEILGFIHVMMIRLEKD